MKRITAIFLTLMLLFGLTAFSTESGQSDTDTSSGKENTQLYHFELTEDEMNRINALDRNEKHDWY